MKNTLFVFYFFLVSCSEERGSACHNDTSLGVKAGKNSGADQKITGKFDSGSWTVTIVNTGGSQVLVATTFHSVEVIDKGGEKIAAVVLGVLGGDQSYKLIPPGRERIVEISDEVKGLSGKMVCTIFYMDNLAGQPRNLEFIFDFVDQ